MKTACASAVWPALATCHSCSSMRGKRHTTTLRKLPNCKPIKAAAAMLKRLSMGMGWVNAVGQARGLAVFRAIKRSA